MPNSISEPAEAIRAKALEEGFDVVRFAKAQGTPQSAERLLQFLAEGRHGTMDWLAREPARRADPLALWPDARSVIVLGTNYASADEPFEKRMAQAGDWDAAAKLWNEAANSSSRKVAGRACYNMAIISEINGDLNGALQWAKKAYVVYRTPYALDYVNILQQRQSNDAVLRSQTELTSAP